MAKKIVETPLMKQYLEMKKKHPDAVLLFRVGDFYETFSDDAIEASEILGITLTRRANGSAQEVELAGFPHHALDTYLPKLIRAGKRVAICEQLEDPKLTKKLVKRGITELVTPGTAITDNLLERSQNNFLAALHAEGEQWGVAFLDLSTGEFLAAQGEHPYIDKLLNNFSPKELLLERGKRSTIESSLSSKFLAFEMEDWAFTPAAAQDRLLKQFQTATLKGFGLEDMPLAIIAAGAILHYLDLTCHTQTSHIASISRIEEENFVRLDRFTIRNLELTEPMAPGGKCLFDVINRTVTPMGARLLHRWLLFPVKDIPTITERQDVVDHFFREADMVDSLSDVMTRMGDIERLLSKAASQRISPRELLQLRNSIALCNQVKVMTADTDCQPLTAMSRLINPCNELYSRIVREIAEDAPAALGKGPVFKPGVSATLDELREIAFNGHDYLEQIRRREVEATGIPSLKIAFNNIFGYYIEVTNTHRDKVPQSWVRKQTLVNAERYITPELKDYEEKILRAEEEIDRIESQLYRELVSAIGAFIPTLQVNAHQIANLDVLLSFMHVARAYKYVRPVVDQGLAINIVEGRHPVIERQLPTGEEYISNTVNLSNDDTQIMMITGPNMSGKSALLRQTALIVLMAQMGCFVPAESAQIGLVDKIFTRVGASDNISLGESTFMVEMNEAASILNNMSERSLILFDELGRGTSTYDGISIAWAIVEYLHQHPRIHPKTLFATHYHELNEMERLLKRVVNYNVSVKDIQGRIVFLRKLARGGSEHSFGIHVARLAGMPAAIVERAQEVLKQLEDARRKEGTITEGIQAVGQQGEGNTGIQMSFFQLDDPVLSQIRQEILDLDINNLTPMAALNKLHDIRKILTGRD